VSQFIAGERRLFGYFGIFGIRAETFTFLVGHYVGCWFGQFGFDGGAIYVRDAIEAVDFFVDVLLDIEQSTMPRCDIIESRFPGGRGNEVIRRFIFLAIRFGQIDGLPTNLLNRGLEAFGIGRRAISPT
jgi:hypothetical protein